MSSTPYSRLASRAWKTLAATSQPWDTVTTLNKLTQVYAETGRYADSLAAAKTATKLQPNSELSRQSQDAASALFADLYLGSKGDDLKPVDALAMFFRGGYRHPRLLEQLDRLLVHA